MEKPRGISRREVIRGIVGGGAVLATATVMGYVGNEVLSILEGRTRPAEEFPHMERFSLLDYAPPAEGVIIKSQLVDVRGKTVIFIPDAHPNPGMSPELLVEARQVQREVTALIEDLIQRYGKTPVVLENWPKGLTANDVKERPDDGGGDDFDRDFEMVRRIAQEPNSAKRKTMASEAAANTLTPAGMLLMVTYQDEMIPLGSTTQEETEAVLESASQFGIMDRALRSPEEFMCTSETGENTGLTLRQAMARFEKTGTKRPKNAVDCYCQFRQSAMAIREDFIQDRFIDAPRREVFAALDYEGGEGFVVIVAGMNHLQEGLRLLDEARVNYLVLSPQTVAGRCPVYMREPAAPPEIPLKDDVRGTCANWERKQAVEFQKWLMEE